MVHTRSGNEVHHTAASYGRAARVESARQKKRKAIATKAVPASRRTRSSTRMDCKDDSFSETSSVTNEVRPTVHAAVHRETRLPRATTSLRKPRCTDFGRARHFAFRQGQQYLFCGPCDLWDALPPDRNKKASIGSHRFGCTANHLYFSHPTTLKPQNSYDKRMRTTVLRRATLHDDTGVALDTISSTSSGDDKSICTSSSSSCNSTTGGDTSNVSVHEEECIASVTSVLGVADDAETSITIGSQHKEEEEQGQSVTTHAVILALEMQIEKLKGKIGCYRNDIIRKSTKTGNSNLRIVQVLLTLAAFTTIPLSVSR